VERIRVRFAPSPTGYLHIGNARTALFNWLFARHCGGCFILRIEDTDIDRHVAEAEGLIIQDLKWMGLDWDEGPDKGGPYGPYRQSDRLDIYRSYAQKLVESDRAYYCYCTPEELEASRQKMLAIGQTPQYDGRCLHLSDEQKRAFEKEGRRPSVRFRTLGDPVVVNDLIRGEVSFEGATIGDFIILRSDGRAAYNFAVVIDDIQMEVTHVLRGEDHLSNTPRQILIYQALGFNPPQFGHMPMILGPDRTRLSKRHGATSVVSYREKGYLPEAINNYLALLGWSSPDEEEILPQEKLIQKFTVDRISRSAAIFDHTKLNWMNGNYIREAKLDRITRLCIPFLKEKGYLAQGEVSPEDMLSLEKIMASVQTKMSYLAQVTDLAGVYFEEEFSLDNESQVWLETLEAISVIQALQEVLENALPEELSDGHKLIEGVQKKTGQKGKKLYMPIRIALTGKTTGPELVSILSIVGRDRCLSRVRQVLSQIPPLKNHD
jgi:nondiscriminating glutamyl-tRNA synthetase